MRPVEGARITPTGPWPAATQRPGSPGTGPISGSPSGVIGRTPDQDATTGTPASPGTKRRARRASPRTVSGCSGSSRSEAARLAPTTAAPVGRCCKVNAVPSSLGGGGSAASCAIVGGPASSPTSASPGQVASWKACSTVQGSGAVCNSQPRAPLTGSSTPAPATRARVHGPAATTTAPAASGPASVWTPVTRPLWTHSRRTAAQVRSSAPARRASSAQARVAPVGSSAHPSVERNPPARPGARLGSSATSSAASSSSTAKPAAAVASACSFADAKVASSPASRRWPTGRRSKSTPSRNSGPACASSPGNNSPWLRPDAPAASSARSSTSTSSPRPASSRAQAQPITPPPTTITSAATAASFHSASAGFRVRGRARNAPRPAAGRGHLMQTPPHVATRQNAEWLLASRPPNAASGLVPVDVGVAELEAELLVETVGSHPRGTRGEVDATGALILGQAQRRHRQGGADTLATGGLVDDDILDSRSHPGGERKGDEGEHADDGALAACDEQRGGLMLRDPGKPVGTERRRRAGQLREQSPGGLDQLVGDSTDGFNLDAHGADCTGSLVARRRSCMLGVAVTRAEISTIEDRLVL